MQTKNKWRHRAEHEGRRVIDYGLIMAVVVSLAVGGATGALAAREHYHRNPYVVTRTIKVMATIPKTADEIDGIKSLVKDLKAQGMDQIRIAAIAGNVYGESDGDSNALEAAKNPGSLDINDLNAVKTWVKGNTAGVGLLQWTGDRADGLFAFVDNDGLHRQWNDASLQTDYLKLELNDYSLWTVDPDGFWTAPDVASATKALEEGFIRPSEPEKSLQRRTKAALQVYSALQLGTL